MRRYYKHFYWLCVAVLLGYMLFNAVSDYPAECWESGPTKSYCKD